MQVFLPERDFKEVAAILDQKRLVKQLLEGRQILAALAGESKGWVNHPATRMFRNHERVLYMYLFAIATEMGKRGYKWQNNWQAIEQTYMNKFSATHLGKPSWMMDERFDKVIHTHRANLYLKAPELYPQYEQYAIDYRADVCCDRCNYFWPVVGHGGN